VLDAPKTIAKTLGISPHTAWERGTKSLDALVYAEATPVSLRTSEDDDVGGRGCHTSSLFNTYSISVGGPKKSWLNEQERDVEVQPFYHIWDNVEEA
jgi:hypothetical protein